MIRENSLFGKLIRIKTSSKALFDSFMAGFQPLLQTCPCCGAKGSCRIRSYYGRSLVDFISGSPVRHDLRVLAEYFIRLSTVEKPCERFSITLSQLRRWLRIFKAHKDEWLGVLSSMETSGFSFLNSLFELPAYSGFASSFVRRFACSFLQSHKNPVPYCQQVFGA